jgi:hypothetical protein
MRLDWPAAVKCLVLARFSSNISGGLRCGRLINKNAARKFPEGAGRRAQSVFMPLFVNSQEGLPLS